MQNGTRPTVVLVHGAFGDASHWVPVVRELQSHDVAVLPGAPRQKTEMVPRVIQQVSGRETAPRAGGQQAVALQPRVGHELMLGDLSLRVARTPRRPAF